MGVGEEPGQGKDLGASPYPRAGDVWRSRDKRDKGLTVRVGWVDESTGRVHIRRFRQSSVAIRRWLRDYEFVSRRLRSGRLREGVVMGEEPERLRGEICEFCGFAVVDGRCCRAGREHRAATKLGHKGRADSGQVTAQSETPPDVPERPPLTAEPERLRARIERAREKHWMHIELPMREADALLAEVERLAGENELQEACLASLERIMFAFGTEHGRSRDEMEARAEHLVADAEQVERLAREHEQSERLRLDALVMWNESQAECERLAGRVAALETALGEAADWLDEDLAHAPDTPTSMADRSLVASWRGVLADVGGSE